MFKYLYIPLTLTVLTVLTNPAYAGNGKQLYTKGCTGCHGNEVFTRKDRKIHDYKALTERVKRCSYTLERNWFDDEIKQVSDYLNTNFYKF